MEKKRKSALLIGINYIETPSQKLFGCINDCLSMKYFLNDALGYRLDDIKILRDDVNMNEVKPTKENIIRSIRELIYQSKYMDEIWIHYSGHGIYVRDLDKDEKDGYDEALVPCDVMNKGVILDDYLNELLKDTKCRTIITMDCCHAGSSWDIQYVYNLTDKGEIVKECENNKVLENKEIYMLSGSNDHQTGADYYNSEWKYPMGVFTMVLLDCIRRSNHNIDIITLYKEINRVLRENNFQQRCLLSSSSSDIPCYMIKREVVKVMIDNGVLEKDIVKSDVLNKEIKDKPLMRFGSLEMYKLGWNKDKEELTNKDRVVSSHIVKKIMNSIIYK